jgi:hypothetical protein
LWNKTDGQATVWVEITDATLRALPAILNPAQDGYDDTADTTAGEDADVEDLFESPIAARIHHVSQIHHGNGTLTHYRGLRDDGMHGHRGRGSTYDPSTPRALEGPEVHAPRMVDAGHHVSGWWCL